MRDWNAELYVRFERERTLPVTDLIARIDLEAPGEIIDLGCGTGNSTRELIARWPGARVTGLDRSRTMLNRARTDMPGVTWIQADIGAGLAELGKFDLVFSNAALQWIPGHETLLPRLFELVNDGGIFAAQVPNTTTMAISGAVARTVSREKWEPFFDGSGDTLTYHEPREYYDILRDRVRELSLWEIHYQHVMANHAAIVEWYESTGLRPYLNRLGEDRIAEFKTDVLAEVEAAYPVQRDGSVIFPFRRIFMVARR